MEQNLIFSTNTTKKTCVSSRCSHLFQALILLPLIALLLPPPASAYVYPPTTIKKENGLLKATAVFNRAEPEASMWDIEVFEKSGKPPHWDFTLKENTSYNKQMSSFFGPKEIKGGKVRVKGTLHKFDFYEEKATFKNLELSPIYILPNKEIPLPRFFALKTPQSVTTPSGIRITLSAPSAKSSNYSFKFSDFGGNVGGVFVTISTTPNAHLVQSLPNSPLFKKYRRPETIKLDVAAPNGLISYQADNTFTGFMISIPKLKTATHIDELTFIMRQRVELATFPFDIAVPVSNLPISKKQRN